MSVGMKKKKFSLLCNFQFPCMSEKMSEKLIEIRIGQVFGACFIIMQIINHSLFQLIYEELYSLYAGLVFPIEKLNWRTTIGFILFSYSFFFLIHCKWIDREIAMEFSLSFWVRNIIAILFLSFWDNKKEERKKILKWQAFFFLLQLQS